MFKNHLKIAWRNLLKDRQFTLLNVLGLSAGLACALLIFLWVKDERSYDKIFANDSQLYISVGVFALVIAMSVMITLLTVSFQAIKAAVANPVKSLRTE
jgi:hypothetical protein